MFFYAADGTCILKPHLVLDKVRAIGIRTRINASEIGRWQTPSDDGPVSASVSAVSLEDEYVF